MIQDPNSHFSTENTAINRNLNQWQISWTISWEISRAGGRWVMTQEMVIKATVQKTQRKRPHKWNLTGEQSIIKLSRLNHNSNTYRRSLSKEFKWISHRIRHSFNRYLVDSASSIQMFWSMPQPKDHPLNTLQKQENHSNHTRIISARWKRANLWRTANTARSE